MKAILFILFLSPLFADAQVSFRTKVTVAAGQLKCAEPTEEEPVSLNAIVVTDKDSVAIIVKVQMASGWHIYDYVPSTMPYIAMEYLLEVPENLKVVGAWEKTKPSSSAMDPGVLIYENEAVFIRKALKLPSGKGNGIIRTGLYYQTCDSKQCLPPTEKTLNLKL